MWKEILSSCEFTCHKMTSLFTSVISLSPSLKAPQLPDDINEIKIYYCIHTYKSLRHLTLLQPYCSSLLWFLLYRWNFNDEIHEAHPSLSFELFHLLVSAVMHPHLNWKHHHRHSYEIMERATWSLSLSSLNCVTTLGHYYLLLASYLHLSLSLSLSPSLPIWMKWNTISTAFVIQKDMKQLKTNIWWRWRRRTRGCENILCWRVVTSIHLRKRQWNKWKMWCWSSILYINHLKRLTF